MNNEDVKLINGFINRCFSRSTKYKNKTLKKFNEKFIKNEDKKIRFKNLPLQKQYEIIKSFLSIGRYDLDDWYTKRIVNLIIRLHDQSIDEKLTKLLLNENTPYPIKILKNTKLTIDLLRWLIEDYKQLKYNYIKELIKDNKLKQEFEELYKFLTL